MSKKREVWRIAFLVCLKLVLSVEVIVVRTNEVTKRVF